MGWWNPRTNQKDWFLCQKLMVVYTCGEFPLLPVLLFGRWSPGDSGALCILHCDSPTELRCRKRSQTCSAGTQEQSDSFCCLLCPDPRHGRQRWWALLFTFLISEFLHPPWGAFGFGHRHPCDLLSSLERGIGMLTICVVFQHPHNGKSTHPHLWKLTT